MTLMFIALTMTLLLVLTVLRHLLEPACPRCTAKNWTNDPKLLCCVECGWTNVAQVPATELAATQLGTVQLATAQYSASQYEIGFH